MRIGPMFKWFGSKWSATKRGSYRAPNGPIFEPYAGGAGYSLNYCDRQVTIWERNPMLRLLWGWLIKDATPAAILDIPVGTPVGTAIESLNLSIGQATLLKHWQRTNNVGNCWTISPWGNKPGQWTANTRARVAEQVTAIKHWTLAEPTFDVPGTYFIDPPYQYNYGYGFKDFDYQQLCALILKIPIGSRIIACEAACQKTGRIPDYLPFVVSHRQVTSRRKISQSHHSAELSYIEDR